MKNEDIFDAIERMSHIEKEKEKGPLDSKISQRYDELAKSLSELSTKDWKEYHKYLIKDTLNNLNKERDRYSMIIREVQDRHLREVLRLHDKLAEYERNNSRLQNRVELYSSKISEMNNILKRFQDKSKEKS